MSIRLDIVSVIIASSYLTLVAFSRGHAVDFMGPYAIVMFLLTLVSLIVGSR